MRFALLDIKVALVSILSKFTFQPGTKMKEPLDYDTDYQVLWPRGGLWAKAVFRNEVLV